MDNILVSSTQVVKKALQQKRVRTALIGLYVLIIIGLSATARAEDSSNWKVFPHPPKQTQSVAAYVTDSHLGNQDQLESFVGEVLVTVDGRCFLMNGESSYELRSVEDLTSLNGFMVDVIGTEIKHKVGPVYKLQTVTPLQTEEGLAVAPVVIVHNVSIIE